MAKKKITRKELLKTTDEFLTFSARAALFIREHSRAFSYIGAAILACLLIYLGINTYMNHINKKGQETYNTAYYAFIKNIKPNTDQKDLKKYEELFQKVIDEYGLSKVSRLALPQLAHLRFLEKKYDEAISIYKEFLAEVSDDIPYQSLAIMGMAACYEARGELRMAIEALSRIMAGPDDFFKEQAMLSLARVYRLAKQEDKSREILKEFVEKFKSSPFLPVAKAQLNKYQP